MSILSSHALTVAALALAAALSVPVPVLAQTLAQDTLAVRLLLDENQSSVSVSQVVRIEGGRVTQLELEGLGLVRLPRQVATLTALRRLNLSGNLLDTLPVELWDLTGLAQLDLGGNRLRALDGRAGKLRDLLFLGLRGNDLASLPAELSALEQLETLLLSDNLLDSLPAWAAELPFLRYLDVSHNRLTAVPYTLGALTTLDSLDLRHNRLETLPDFIRGLPARTAVRLGGNLLCSLTPELEAWADSKDPTWRSTQQCGAAVLAGMPRDRAARLSRSGGLFDAHLLVTLPEAWPAGALWVELRDPRGRVLASLPVPSATGLREARLPLPPGAGPRVAELRVRASGARARILAAALLP